MLIQVCQVLNYNQAMTFLEQLKAAERSNQSMLCVGLDPEPAKFPAHLAGDASKIYDFCAAIVDATADLVISFKPQIAYFHAAPKTSWKSSCSTCGRLPPTSP
jgi:orotidine-5'-phosphate decarboxylase